MFKVKRFLLVIFILIILLPLGYGICGFISKRQALKANIINSGYLGRCTVCGCNYLIPRYQISVLRNTLDSCCLVCQKCSKEKLSNSK